MFVALAAFALGALAAAAFAPHVFATEAQTASKAPTTKQHVAELQIAEPHRALKDRAEAIQRMAEVEGRYEEVTMQLLAVREKLLSSQEEKTRSLRRS